MGWFGDRMLSQKPRKSGCICVLLAALVLVLVLVGCGGPTLHEGEVIAKDYDAARDETSLYCGMHNRDGICVAWLPQTIHHPERFRLRIQGYHDGDLIEQWKTVDMMTWNTLQEGDQWSDGSGDG